MRPRGRKSSCTPTGWTIPDGDLFRTLATALSDERVSAAQVLACFAEIDARRLYVPMGPHLTLDNADELIAAAAHRRKSEIEVLIADRFPRRDVATKIQVLPARRPSQTTYSPQSELVVRLWTSWSRRPRPKR